MQHSQSPWDLTFYDKATQREFPDTSSPARAAAVHFETTIRFEPIEHGSFFAPDGRATLFRTGTAFSIPYSDAELQSASGMLFSHNHPGGTSLSNGDILMACIGKLVEIRAVCEEWRYSLIFKNGWPSRPAMVAEIRRLEPIVAAEVHSDIRSGHLQHAYLTLEIRHRIVHLLADHFHILYNRQRS